MNIQQIKISEIKRAEYNPRKITKEEGQGLRASLLLYGQVENLVLNKDKTLIGGHKRLDQIEILAKEPEMVKVNADSKDFIVNPFHGQDTVPCVVLDLNKKDEKKLNIALNNPHIQGSFDLQMLGDLLNELKIEEDYLDLRFDLLEPLEMRNGKGKEDNPNLNPPTDPVTKTGDIYELNGHRVICGSSTDLNTINALMNGRFLDLLLTDPPYNVDYTGKTKDALKIENDKMSNDQFYQFLLDFYTGACTVMKPGASAYIFHADSEGHNFRKAFVDAGLKLAQCLIWLKNSMVMGRQDYHWKHEPVLYGWKEGASHQWFSDRKQTTILEFDRPSRNAEHPTMKPINILAYLIQNNTKGKDIVGDFFLESGSTLIACEQTDRLCYGIELDPKYVDVIVRRYIKFMTEEHKTFEILRNGKPIDNTEFNAK